MHHESYIQIRKTMSRTKTYPVVDGLYHLQNDDILWYSGGRRWMNLRGEKETKLYRMTKEMQSALQLGTEFIPLGYFRSLISNPRTARKLLEKLGMSVEMLQEKDTSVRQYLHMHLSDL